MIDFYHGLSTEAGAKQILKTRELRQPKRDEFSRFTPMLNSIYITKNLSYALIYALGGNFVGGNAPGAYFARHKDDPFGYIAVVDDSKGLWLKPDEDQIGEMLAYAMENRKGRTFRSVYMEGPEWLTLRIIEDFASAYWQSETDAGESFNDVWNEFCEDWDTVENHVAVAKHMLQMGWFNDEQLDDLLELSDQYSAREPVSVREFWRLPKVDFEQIKAAKQFWDLAERLF